jgi:hypothetical protein
MRATLLIEFIKDKKYNLQLYLCNEGVLTKMQTELGTIQYYLVLKIVFKCESIIDKT